MSKLNPTVIVNGKEVNTAVIFSSSKLNTTIITRKVVKTAMGSRSGRLGSWMRKIYIRFHSIVLKLGSSESFSLIF